MSLTRETKRRVKNAIKNALWAVLQGRLSFAHWFWGIEGVNRVLYQCESAFVASVLVKYGAVVGADDSINAPLLIHNADRDYSNLCIGRRCHIGKDVFLDLRDRITIEDHATISMRVTILTHTDVGHSPLRKSELPPSQAPVVIRKGAYLGAGATILQGVSIGECSVVGAGAVVVDDIPEHVVAIGIPARVIRSVNTGVMSR